MRKSLITILPIIIIIFDLLFRYKLDDNYTLIYYFTISYVAFFFYFLNNNRTEVLFRFMILLHFIILFLYLTIDLFGALDNRGIGHVGDWWGRITIKENCFIYPNIICFVIISILLLVRKQTHEKNRLSKIIVSFVLILSLTFGLFYYYNVNYNFVLDYPY